ncbi:hypothetical protein E1193_04085 [Micromonospora sp. KC606]|uniref:hypothetical protein n=1 Tax=Micromonospora sp. KC606 TaxID=2530379 RepID=UPI001042D385|nr:hypothetical protein [Micromonospora sp. KC606]TDC84950.1 hypothetical protein E1193_04085 [Micromonospora sp. KC606]
MSVDWMPLLSTGAWALIALSGSFLVDLRRERDTRARDRDLDRWRTGLRARPGRGAQRASPTGDHPRRPGDDRRTWRRDDRSRLSARARSPERPRPPRSGALQPGR